MRKAGAAAAMSSVFFFFNDTATTEIYTLSLHDALPIYFSDKDFVYGRALAQTAGVAVMRLADADLLPFDFDDFSEAVRRYVNEVRKLASDAREHTVERNRQINDGVFAAIEDPRIKTVPPKKEEVPPFLNFAPLDNGMAALQRAAEDYREAMTHVSASAPPAALRQANRSEEHTSELQSLRHL